MAPAQVCAKPLFPSADLCNGESVTCNSFLQGVSCTSGSVVFACAQTSLTLEAMACVYTHSQASINLIHINEADKFQLRLLERLVTTCRSTPR
jgi:hypothetical protein